ncbi:MAG: glucose 1-dehydrogenase [Rhodospirillaceae bacterium]|nr:MAG: glucose 1-dehydrogenase [Rhodospirillaceae bacterium]
MDGLVQGKVAIITGAGSGSGRAAALLFARHGAKVIAADLDLAWAEQTVSAIVAESGHARAVQCDVADEGAVSRAVQSAVESYGRLDIMYNNAGITIQVRPGEGLRRFVDTTLDEIKHLQAVNITGVINGCKAAIRQFEAQGNGGVIVNTASVAGLIGYGGTVYGSTKGAVTSLTRALAIEMAGAGIRINSVCPAGMPTRFVGIDPEGPNAEAVKIGMGKAHPLGRAIDPMDCANAALFLASDLASNITGVNLPVDGGISAGIQIRR